MTRTGIVLAQLGGPESLDEVEGFIRSIFKDPRLVKLPGGRRTRSVVSTVISRLRRKSVRSHYALIGGGSPIVATTQRQANLLQTELDDRGHEVVVVVAQRHSQPDTAKAVNALISAGVERIVLLPLFPQHSGATTGSSEDELRRVLAEQNVDLELYVVRSWCEHPSYLQAQASLVEESLGLIPAEELDSALLVFSAHGLPQKMIDQGDQYVDEIEATVSGVVSRLGRPPEHTIAYQSRVGPVKWVGPNVKKVVSSAAEKGHTHLCIVPIAFVSEHVETLYELDIDLKELAADSGIESFVRTKCLDDDPIVGAVLADVIESHL